MTVWVNRLLQRSKSNQTLSVEATSLNKCCLLYLNLNHMKNKYMTGLVYLQHYFLTTTQSVGRSDTQITHTQTFTAVLHFHDSLTRFHGYITQQ